VVSGGRWLVVVSGPAGVRGVLVRRMWPGGRGMGDGERLAMQVRGPRVKARTPEGAGSQVMEVSGGDVIRVSGGTSVSAGKSVRRRWRARR
jgi:hypothetical protein